MQAHRCGRQPGLLLRSRQPGWPIRHRHCDLLHGRPPGAQSWWVRRHAVGAALMCLVDCPRVTRFPLSPRPQTASGPSCAARPSSLAPRDPTPPTPSTPPPRDEVTADATGRLLPRARRGPRLVCWANWRRCGMRACPTRARRPRRPLWRSGARGVLPGHRGRFSTGWRTGPGSREPDGRKGPPAAGMANLPTRPAGQGEET